MALAEPPPLGFAVPDTYHAVSVQMPHWEDMIGMMLGHPRIKQVQQIGYPRSFLHQDVAKIHHACVVALSRKHANCLVYPSFDHAISCAEYMRCMKVESESSIFGQIEVCPIEIGKSQLTGNETRLFAVVFDEKLLSIAMTFWRLTGTGISSRLAETLLQKLSSLRPLQLDSINQKVEGIQPDELTDINASNTICGRIASLMKRPSPQLVNSHKIEAADVFLYPTGMSAIYHCNLLLQSWRPDQSVVFGFPYELTLKLLQTFGSSCRFYGLGTADELDELEVYLEFKASKSTSVQSVWCECASNPLLRTVDFNRLRTLADRFGFILVVDDTIGSFANVDVGVADIVVTSLTKSFSGYGDVMGGSLVLNPASPFYRDLKDIIAQTYRNELFAADAVQLEYNSRKFLPRVAAMNQTAQYLVSLLENYKRSSFSTVSHVYYPSTCWSVDNYHDRMRTPTPEFTPGYGGLFTIEFDTVKAASTFFNALQIHKGPSLGITLTLAQPYVQTVFAREKEWAASYGLSETIVRISVGLENSKALGKAFRKAVQLADRTKAGLSMFENLNGCV